MSQTPNHSTSDFNEPKRDDESSGPFSASESLRERALDQIKIEPRSTRFFKGFQVIVPWSAAIGLLILGGWNLWLHQHDDEKDNINRDSEIELLKKNTTDFNEKMEKKVDKLSDKIDNLTQIILRK